MEMNLEINESKLETANLKIKMLINDCNIVNLIYKEQQNVNNHN